MKNKDLVLLGHGSGGELSGELLHEVIFEIFRDVQPTDGAVLDNREGKRLVFTSDSYVVKPLFFPGGDIGKIAVNGTVNDLAMMGAEPSYISCGFIIEEGFLLTDLRTICNSMRQAAQEAGVKIVTGDTKVVGRGEADGIFINTAGVGFVSPDLRLDRTSVQPGDCIIINGNIGDHGTAVLAKRLGVSFEPELVTDSAQLADSVRALLTAGIMPRVMRDITRGGLGSITCELAGELKVDYLLKETEIPIDPRVKRACDIWGFDPLHVACEGRFLAVVKKEDAARAVEVLQKVGPSRQAAQIGEIATGSGNVIMLTAIGGRRNVRLLQAELLPRIC